MRAPKLSKEAQASQKVRRIPMTAFRSLLIASLTSAVFMGACSKSSLPVETTVEGTTSTAPSAASAKQEQKTLIRFINATQGPKDLYFQDMPAFTNIDFAGITPYMALPNSHPDARHDLKLYNSANAVGVPIASNSEVENSGGHYTILVLNRNGKPTLTVIADRLKAPAPGKTKLRVIHAAPGIDKLDIFRSGDTNGIFSGQSFANVTDYREMEPATTELAIRKHGSKTDEVKLTDVALEAGKLYTIVLFGGEGNQLSSKVIEDQLVSP